MLLCNSNNINNNNMEVSILVSKTMTIKKVERVVAVEVIIPLFNNNFNNSSRVVRLLN